MLHPGRFWCHCRMVYLPMSYIYGRRGTAKARAFSLRRAEDRPPGGSTLPGGPLLSFDLHKRASTIHSSLSKASCFPPNPAPPPQNKTPCKRQDSPLTAALRTELYTTPYADVDWNAARGQCAKEDLYYPHPLVQARVPGRVWGVVWWRGLGVWVLVFAPAQAPALLPPHPPLPPAPLPAIKSTRYRPGGRRTCCGGGCPRQSRCCWARGCGRRRWRRR